MLVNEIIKRGFSTEGNGKVLDEYGNEYRNEEGRIEYVELDYIANQSNTELIQSISVVWDMLKDQYKVPQILLQEFQLLLKETIERNGE